MDGSCDHLLVAIVINYWLTCVMSLVFRRLVAAFGSQRQLAHACGVTPQAVQKWQRSIPASKVLLLERLSAERAKAANDPALAVRREEIRPDLYVAG